MGCASVSPVPKGLLSPSSGQKGTNGGAQPHGQSNALGLIQALWRGGGGEGSGTLHSNHCQSNRAKLRLLLQYKEIHICTKQHNAAVSPSPCPGGGSAHLILAPFSLPGTPHRGCAPSPPASAAHRRVSAHPHVPPPSSIIFGGCGEQWSSRPPPPPPPDLIPRPEPPPTPLPSAPLGFVGERTGEGPSEPRLGSAQVWGGEEGQREGAGVRQEVLGQGLPQNADPQHAPR